MRGMSRLIEGLVSGDPTAPAVLVFAVVGTIVIVGVVAMIRRSRGR